MQQSSNYILATRQNTWKGQISLRSDRPFSNENSLTCHGRRITSVNNLVNNSSCAAMSQKQDMLMDLRRRKMIKGRGERQMVEQGRIHPSARLSGPEPSLNLHAGSLVLAAQRRVFNPAPCRQESYRSIIHISTANESNILHWWF